MQRILLSLGACLCMLLAVGCDSHKKDTGPAMTGRDKMNLSKLDGQPDAVRTAFARDLPDSTVTSVTTFNDAGGRMVYQISYVRDGRMQNAYYTADGYQVPAPSAPTN